MGSNSPKITSFKVEAGLNDGFFIDLPIVHVLPQSLCEQMHGSIYLGYLQKDGHPVFINPSLNSLAIILFNNIFCLVLIKLKLVL